MPELVTPAERRPALTASTRAVLLDAQVGTKKRLGRTKKLTSAASWVSHTVAGY